MAQNLKVQLVELFWFNPWLKLHFGANRDCFLLGISKDNLIGVELFVFTTMNLSIEEKKRVVAIFWIMRRRKQRHRLWVHPLHLLRPSLGEHLKVELMCAKYPDQFIQVSIVIIKLL